MLICDANNIIIGINARYPGFVHDAAIWQISEIRNYLRTCYYNGDYVSFFIGDSGCSQESWLLTPLPILKKVLLKNGIIWYIKIQEMLLKELTEH